MSEYKKFTKDVGIVAISNFLLKIRNILFITIVGNFLGASEYGIYIIVMLTVTLLAPFSALGLRGAMVRFLSGERDREKIAQGYYTVLIVPAVLSFIFSIIVSVFAPAIASILGDINATNAINIGAFLIFLKILNGVSFEFFRTSRKIIHFCSLQIAVNFAEVISALVLVLNNFGLESILYSFLIIRFSIFLFASILIFNEIGISYPNFSLLREYLRFSIPLIPRSISGKIIDSFDRYLIGFFLNSTAVGIYSAAYGIGSIMRVFMGIINVVLFPTLSKLWEENREHELKIFFRYTLKYFLILAIPSIFGLTVLSKEILTIIAGSEFVYQGYLIIPVIAIAITFFHSTFQVFGHIFLLVKRTYINAVVLFSGALLNIFLNIILIPYFQSNYNYGIMGAAIATFISFFTIGIATVVLSRKYFTFEIEKSFILKSVISASLMAVLVYKIRVNTFPEIFIPISVGAIFYFILLFIFRAFSEREIKFFKEILISAKSKFLRI